ncbi:unnamed protein product [Cuscuta campestris]|uniref:PHD finger protein ALFIN-LIKE n=1 Tax=Cuscuta campestris TaxID=132261 RepID=A0A484M8C7_9ASTE|nr:unnamed protein product [Cuscuta campestris]
MQGIPPPMPRTVGDVFEDFKGRRRGLVKALTTDVAKLYQQCDPERENLCLYGFPNETWEVNLPVDEVPSELPEPTLGINFVRDGMQYEDWLLAVAAHSDSWLLSTAFFFGARFGFGKSERKRLFQMINELPTLFEVVTRAAKHGTVADPNSCMKRTSGRKQTEVQHREVKMSQRKEAAGENDEEEEEEEEEEAQGDTPCGVCGEFYAVGEFWILCDVCERWFHGECVKITEAKAKHIKQYKCPSCSKKRARV